MRRLKRSIQEQLVAVSGHLRRELEGFGELASRGHAASASRLAQLTEAQLNLVRTLGALDGPEPEVAHEQQNIDPGELLKRHYVTFVRGPGSPDVKLVRYSLDDWRCPVCGSEDDFGFAQRIPIADARPAEDADLVVRDLAVSCSDCEWKGTVDLAARTHILEKHGLQPPREVGMARGTLGGIL